MASLLLYVLSPSALIDGAGEGGSLYVWGANDHGALCVPALEDAAEPRRVLALRSQYVRAVGAAAGLSVCATGSGAVMLWGGAFGGLPRLQGCTST